jgi:hypothetical protein
MDILRIDSDAAWPRKVGKQRPDIRVDTKRLLARPPSCTPQHPCVTLKGLSLLRGFGEDDDNA